LSRRRRRRCGAVIQGRHARPRPVIRVRRSAAIARCSLRPSAAWSRALASCLVPVSSPVGRARSCRCNRRDHRSRVAEQGGRIAIRLDRPDALPEHRDATVGRAEMFEAVDADGALRNLRPCPGSMMVRSDHQSGVVTPSVSRTWRNRLASYQCRRAARSCDPTFGH
jgi:hypothetical protein